MPATSVRNLSVFLNVPYDEDFEPVLLTLMTALVSVGKIPRATVEIPIAGNRLKKIMELLDECRASIHELTPPAGEPRFNMPFELGLACQLHQMSPKKRPHDFIVLEREKHRLHRTLSDMSGHDAKIHGGTEKGAIQVILDAFPSSRGNPSVDEVKSLHAEIKTTIVQLKNKENRSDVFSPDMWRKSVQIMIAAATTRGLIEED